MAYSHAAHVIAAHSSSASAACSCAQPRVEAVTTPQSTPAACEASQRARTVRASLAAW